MKINLLPPAIIRYSDRLPEGVGGMAQGPLVTIHPKYEADEGIHAHELEHVRQWWVTLTLHALLYLFVRRYRLWAEARAYREQMRHVDRRGHRMTLDEAAACLANSRYRLDLSHEQAIAALMNL